MNNTDALNIKILGEIPARLAAHEAVAVCLFEDEPRVSDGRRDGGSDDDLRRLCERLARDDEFRGEAETALFIHRADAGKNAGRNGARRLLLIGLGTHAEFNRPQAAAMLRRAAAMAVRRAGESRLRHLYFVLPEPADECLKNLVSAVAEGAHYGLYDGGFYQERDEETPPLERFTIVAPGQDDEPGRAALDRARVIAEAVNWSRSLVDQPGGALPPREFARRAAEMAESFGLHVESLGADEIRARGMGGLWGVGQGSHEEPALIVVRYEPAGTPTDNELWAFVGKGITFDTGGISLKPSKGMEEMKADMAGGAAVLGALRAIAQLRPQRRIVGIVPSAENMPSGRAIKPGDVIRTLAGYTIEVVDTDAEGRLVLVDGIAYARELGAARIVDLATLTGSIIVALGDHRAGLFSTNDEWADAVRAAAERAGDFVWRMPVSDDYEKRIESPIADFKNYGGRPDATAAALLLSKFAAGTPWAHLDIAATAWYEEAQPHAPKGASGTGVRTLVELACGEGQAGCTSGAGRSGSLIDRPILGQVRPLPLDTSYYAI